MGRRWPSRRPGQRKGAPYSDRYDKLNCESKGFDTSDLVESAHVQSWPRGPLTMEV